MGRELANVPPDDPTLAALSAFDEAFTAYLHDPYPEPASPLSAETRSEYAPFYEESERRVSALESSFADLVSVVESSGTGDDLVLPSVTLDDLLAVTEPWVAAMREQQDLSSHCVLTAPDPAGCLSEMIAENGVRWQATADASNSLRATE